MGASAAASAAFGGGGNSAIGTTQAGQLAQQHMARMEAMRMRGGLGGMIGLGLGLVNQGPQVGTAEQIAASGINGVAWDGDEFEDNDKNLTRAWLRTKGNSIEGGTSEVQLNVISKRVLGLPSQ